MAWEERMRTIERNGEIKLKQKFLTPASWDNGIKKDIVVVVVAVVVLLIDVSITITEIDRLSK